MITALNLLLPAGLAAYCFYSAMKRPIFLLGIPFLQVMQQSVFFKNIKLFWIPGRIGGNYLILVWMVLAWAWVIYRTEDQEWIDNRATWRPGRILPEEHVLMGLAILVLAKLLWVEVSVTDTKTLTYNFALWGLPLVGYWLVRGIVSRSSSEDVAALLTFVAVATGIGSALFVVHQGLRIPIYQVTEYLVFTYKGQELSRSFWFMPPFLLFALALAVARRSWNVGTIGIMAVTMVAVVVSYTRSLLIAAAAVVAVVLALPWLKEGHPGLFLRRVSKLGAILALVVVVLVVALPTPTDYFLSRMESLTGAATVTEDQNVLVRQNDLSTVAATLSDRNQLLLGAGLGTSDELFRKADDWTADSTWVGVVYSLGLFGVALTGAVFVLFGVRAFRLYMSSSGTAEFLGVAYLGAVLAMLATTFASWTFLDPRFSAMGFWLFAFISGEAVKRNSSASGHHAGDSQSEDAGNVGPIDPQDGMERRI